MRGAPEHRTQQYFETIGNRAMYKDGWWLAMKTERIPWVLTPDALAPYAPGVWDPDAGPARALLPARRLHARPTISPPNIPTRSQELKDLFWEEAERYKVLPLLGSAVDVLRDPAADHQRTTFEFRGDVQNVMPGMIPRIYNRSYAITADLVVPEGGAEGVIVAEADHLGGFSLYVTGGKLTHTYSMMGVLLFRQVAEEDLPTGEVTVRMEFAADEAQAGDRRRGDAVHRRPTGRQGAYGPHRADPVLAATPGWTSAVTTVASWTCAYEDRKPFAFTGTVKKVVFDIKPHLSDQDELDLHAEAHRGNAAGSLAG